MASTNAGPEKKVALITGATGGIGSATAIAFAKLGFSLALHYNSASDATRTALSSAIESAYGPSNTPFAFFQADLGSYDAVRTLHAQATQRLGDIDILFLNAGASMGVSGVHSLAEVSMETFEATWRLNAGSGFLLTQLCVPHMESAGWGRVIFNSSIAAFMGGVVGPHYASSKAAMHGFIHWLAPRVAARGVTVNGVAPALVSGTSFIGRGGSGDDEAQKGLAKKLPVGRLGLPEEIAETVVWMVKTGYVTNKVIAVDGGLYAY